MLPYSAPTITLPWRNFYDRSRLGCRRAARLDFIIQMPRVSTLLELRKDVLGDRVALFLGEPILQGLDSDMIEANFKKGVLTVTLPKSTDAQKAEKKITVKAA